MAADSPGGHLLAELKWVHGILRHDLRVLQELAAQIGSGAPSAQAGDTIRALRVRSPLWQMRVNCLRYCQFVHSHHGAEDVMLFPALRRSNPALGPTVDRLEADHRRISDLLDQVESLADLLGENDSDDTRGRLIHALQELGPQLLEHLDFEEESIGPTLGQWTRRPY